jgi:hypothetical protein
MIMPIRMPRLLNVGSYAFGVLTVVSLAFGAAIGFGVVGQEQRANLLSVPTPVKTFGSAEAGTEVSVAYQVTNRSAHVIRILGATASCGAHGCIEATGLPLAIEPSAARDVVVCVHAGAPGEFAETLTLYTDCPSPTKLVLQTRGQVTAAIVGR